MSKKPPAEKTEAESASPTASASIWDVLIERMHEFSAAERKVARIILTNSPTIGLETIARLAELADVSGPTVIRFVNRLGFDNFPDFQSTIRAELDARMASPMVRYGPNTPIGEVDEILGQHRNVFAKDLQQTFDTLPPSEFHAAVDLLADPRHRVWIIGGRFSRVLAHYLHLHLQQLRPNTFLLGNDEIDWAAAILDAGRRDVLVAFDYRRYQSTTIEFSRAMANAGTSIVLFTDRWLSPIADVAQVVLPSIVESPSPFETLVPGLAVVEALVAGLVAAIGESGRRRVERYEAITERMVVEWGQSAKEEL
jgi:DNA-binding MurR/RpiR family transcriptional regulator